MKNVKITAILYLLIVATAMGQSKYILSEHGEGIKTVAETKSVVFYGMDFSLMRLTDAKKVELDSDLERFFGGWISTFEKLEYVDHVKKYLHKKEFVYSPGSVQSRYKLVPEEWCILDDYSFSFDTLQSAIKTYNLKEKEGVGFVINIENFNKRYEKGTMFMTFFDIKTKDVLWSVETWGEPGGMGMSKYWMVSVLHAYSKYINYYNKEIKKAKKS